MEILKDNLHHAYVFIGDEGALDKAPRLIFEHLGMQLEGNPDIAVLYAESIGIDEVRNLIRRAHEKAFGNRKVFVLRSLRVTIEAQNALLKTLEEPPSDTHFFLLASDEGMFLPTLLSRVRLHRFQENVRDAHDVKHFLSLSPKDRLLFVKSFVDEGRNVSEFLDDILGHLRGSDTTEELLNVFRVREFANDRSVNPRLILEHIAVTI